jgi:hypothetical protein
MYTILPKKQHQRLRSRKRDFEKFSAGVYEMLRVTLCFPGGWFSHCCWFGGDFGNIVRPVYLPPAFLILTLLAVGLNLYLKMAVLLCLDQSQCVAQTLVFDDRSVADSLILAEDAVGKQETPGTYLQPAIWKVVDIDVLATQILGLGISFQDDSLTVVR